MNLRCLVTVGVILVMVHPFLHKCDTSNLARNESTVHIAELSARIASLRWRIQGAWNMFVGDRSALFAALRDAVDPCSIWPSRGACLPLEGRLRAIMRRMAGSWIGGSDTPQ